MSKIVLSSMDKTLHEHINVACPLLTVHARIRIKFLYPSLALWVDCWMTIQGWVELTNFLDCDVLL